MKKTQQKIIEETLNVVRIRGNTISVNEFLQKIAKHLANLFEVEYVLINKYSLKTPTITETVVVCNKERIVSNFSYELANTPCENVINKDICAYPSNIQSRFPKDELLKKMNLESYVGIPLWYSTGDPIGLISLLDIKPITEIENIKIILQIVALKVEKLLEKTLYTDILETQLNKLEVVNKKNKEIEEKFFKAFFNNPIAMEIIDIKTGDRIDANESYLQIFGYSKDEFKKGNIFTNKSIIDLNVINKNNKKLIDEGYFKESNFNIVSKSGEIKNLIVSGTRLNIDDGNKALLIFDDVTKFKKINTSLKKSEKKFRELYEKSGDAILIIENGVFTDCNQAAVVMLQYESKQDFLNSHPSKLSPKFQQNGKKSLEEANIMMNTALTYGTHRFEWIHKKKNGKEFLVEVLLTAITNKPNNEVIHCVWRDISNRKKALENLEIAFQLIKENEDYLSSILKNTNEGFWVINTKTITEEVNPEMCKILGYSENEILEKSIFDFVDDENAEIFKEQLKKRALGLSSKYEIYLKRSDGKNVPCLFKTSVIYNNENKAIGSFAMVTDISELKKSQENIENKNKELQNLSNQLSLKNNLLLDSNEKYKNLFELSPVSIWDQDYSEALKLLLKKKAEVKDLKVYLDTNPDFVLECIKKIKTKHVNKTTLNLLGVKDKEELIIQLRKTLDNDAIEVIKKEFLVIASTKKKDLIETTKFIKTDGTEITTILRLIKLDNKGNAIVTLNDITALKIVEQQLLKAKEEAEVSDRLKTEFLNNMSHEIRTPMNGILGFSKMLSEPDIEPSKRNNFINIIQSSGYQLLHIIDDILEISRLGTKQVKVLEEEVCLNDLLLELFSIFDIKAKENKTPLYLKKALSDKESIIISDRTKLNKIFSNLLENALKFTNNGFIEIGYTLKNNNTELEIYVKDTGIGIKPEKQELIFKRFEQAEKELTRKVGGLGLGLSIAKENTELLGGNISVNSEIMEGATFFVNFPFKPVYTTTRIEEKSKKHIILIAEDEEINFMYIETILKSVMNLNCDILHAKNGKEAVSMCKHNLNIDLVLMDLKMPYLNGFNATKQIRKFNSTIPIIAQTAYSTIEEREEALNIGCNDFISKPIEKEILIDVVNNTLGIYS